MSKKHPKILIVDDEMEICQMIVFNFDTRGFETFSANDPEQAMEIVKEQDLDIVIADVRMPKGGGVKLLADIKKYNPEKPKVFLLSGFSDITAEQAIQKGAEALIVKPFRLNELAQQVRVLLENG